MRVVSSRTWSSTSWRPSRSPDTIIVSMPSAVAFLASVPITSSASYPSSSRTGMPIIAVISRTIGNCPRRSSGMLGRPALYSGKASNRNCGFPTSKLTIA